MLETSASNKAICSRNLPSNLENSSVVVVVCVIPIPR